MDDASGRRQKEEAKVKGRMEDTELDLAFSEINSTESIQWDYSKVSIQSEQLFHEMIPRQEVKSITQGLMMTGVLLLL